MSNPLTLLYTTKDCPPCFPRARGPLIAQRSPLLCHHLAKIFAPLDTFSVNSKKQFGHAL